MDGDRKAFPGRTVTIPTGVLDLSPVPPPRVIRDIVGERMGFEAIVKGAGMRNVASGAVPKVYVHPGDRDLMVPVPGRPAYCIGGATLPQADPDRSREILRRLAYGYHDWASREIVARYHRDLKRAAGSAPMAGWPPADDRCVNAVTP